MLLGTLEDESTGLANVSACGDNAAKLELVGQHGGELGSEEWLVGQA